jgi:hypothetical protein
MYSQTFSSSLVADQVLAFATLGYALAAKMYLFPSAVQAHRVFVAVALSENPLACKGQASASATANPGLFSASQVPATGAVTAPVAAISQPFASKPANGTQCALAYLRIAWSLTLGLSPHWSSPSQLSLSGLWAPLQRESLVACLVLMLTRPPNSVEAFQSQQ